MALSSSIITLRPIARQQGIQIPNLLPASQWIDSRALAANVAETYPIPTDAAQDPDVVGTIVGISATNGPLYLNLKGATATVNNADVTNGTACMMLRTDSGGSYLIALPAGITGISMISSADCVVTIEVFG